MSKLITFTFNTKYTDQIQETFSFEQLGMNEQLPSDEIKNKLIIYLKIGYVIVSTYPLASF
ncbi:hypothetical protein AAHH17_00810 [Lysinibacillus capsici]|uniref:hypothetical protein n=1 Tax=Lysinibacillus capsici TaxID=2115968 RepID=UPI0032E47EBF